MMKKVYLICRDIDVSGYFYFSNKDDAVSYCNKHPGFHVEQVFEYIDSQGKDDL